MQAFVASVIGMEKVKRFNKIEKIIRESRDDLLTTGNAFKEHSRQKRQWKAVTKENQSDSVAKALKVSGMDLYSHTSALLKILGTVAVTSCECERSGIVLKI